MIATLADLPVCLGKHLVSDRISPLFIQGDAFEVLKGFPSETIDFAMTSPPYWKKREYLGGGGRPREPLRGFHRQFAAHLWGTEASFEADGILLAQYWGHIREEELSRCTLAFGDSND